MQHVECHGVQLALITQVCNMTQLVIAVGQIPIAKLDEQIILTNERFK